MSHGAHYDRPAHEGFRVKSEGYYSVTTQKPDHTSLKFK